MDRSIDVYAEFIPGQICITASRVMPLRMLSEDEGVTSFPSRTMKMFSPLPSETWPSWERRMASSKPFSQASVLARALLT